jgi:phosphate transport system substrate-binding protein
MKRFSSVIILVLFALVVFTRCKKEVFESRFIEGLTLDNYPKVDGSTSTLPLNVLIASELLGIEYNDRVFNDGTWGIEPKLNKKNSNKFWSKIQSSQTHQSFINLINKETDLILSARKMSPDEKIYADAAGVSLIEMPIALDAFIFIINSYNPVNSLTIEQIKDIYTRKTTNWKDVGGNDASINPYVRNANSGSQELMESLVMKDWDINEFPIASEEIIHSMIGVFYAIGDDVNAISYTIYYYKEYILRGLVNVKSVAVEGIYHDKETISNKSYPYATEVYAVIRSDLAKTSMAYKVYEFLQTNTGKQVINKSGYLAN